MIKKSFLSVICLFIILSFALSANAETKTFIKEYTYQASEFDSKASCRTIALEQVKRLLLEELGTYLENNTEVKNFELTKDKITALTAGIVQTQVLDEKWDGKSYWLKAEVKADPENVAKSIDTLRKDQKRTDEFEERIRKQEEALKEIEKLRSEVASLKNDVKAQENFNKSIATLTDNQNTPEKKAAPVARVKRTARTKKVVASTVTEPKYVASKNAKKYHYPTCRWAQKIKPNNMVVFSSSSEARQAGYVPCKVCKPPASD